MLKTRIITGLTLVALGLLGIIYLSEFWFALVTAALVLIGAWEWANIIGFHHRLLPKMSYCLVMIVGLTIAYFSPHLWIVIIGVAWWLLSLFFIMRFANQPRWMTTIINNTWGKSIIGLLVLIPCWIGMLVVRDSPHGLFYFLYLGFLIGCADTGAYAAGRLFGRRKLIPAVSPGKSWAGVYGALIVAVILAIIGALILKLPLITWPIWIVIALVTILASIVGDLNESLFKRVRGIKDSGCILPGHGGLLDRIDSLTAAAPVFALSLLIYLAL